MSLDDLLGLTERLKERIQSFAPLLQQNETRTLRADRHTRAAYIRAVAGSGACHTRRSYAENTRG
ncbi:MAG: hypothetical protein HW388_1476 [Dehalococcoidia bacterium]|nr:hypothetical protein [Dehalococcoidia bacterium]